MKKIIVLLSLIATAGIFQSAVLKGNFSSVPPEGYTGASGDYCVSCHSSFSLNSGGGSVVATGLPSGAYVPGQAYNFTLKISHGAADRKRWGFSIKAVNSVGAQIGTFTSTNANAAPNGEELSHNNAVTTANSNNYTYTNLKWIAPASPGANDHNVTFYYVGNAANGNGNNQGDYIYSGSTSVVMPIELKSFAAQLQGKEVVLNWVTASEINSDYFQVEKSDNGQIYYPLTKITAAGNTATDHSYNFTDNAISYIGRAVFYRLKLVDKDNRSRYSQAVSVKLPSAATQVTQVYPNIIKPGMSVKAVAVTDKNQQIHISIVDAGGSVLQQWDETLSIGTNQFLFTPNVNKAGYVYMRVTGNGIQQTIPLLVQ